MALTRFRRTTLWSLGVMIVPTLAFVLHDLIFQLPDNQHEASSGFFLTVGGLLLVWVIAGHLAARGARTRTAALGAGTIAAVASVAILWLAFIALNDWFPERMSYEPDRIRAFQASGYPTMREYLAHRHDVGPFPLLMGVAAIAGVAGGTIGRRARDEAV